MIYETKDKINILRFTSVLAMRFHCLLKLDLSGQPCGWQLPHAC